MKRMIRKRREFSGKVYSSYSHHRAKTKREINHMASNFRAMGYQVRTSKESVGYRMWWRNKR